MATPGPNRSCYFGTRTARRAGGGRAAGGVRRPGAGDHAPRAVGHVPAGFRDAGVFVPAADGNGDGAASRETRFAIWLPDENLVLPWVDYVALRVAEARL